MGGSLKSCKEMVFCRSLGTTLELHRPELGSLEKASEVSILWGNYACRAAPEDPKWRSDLIFATTFVCRGEAEAWGG